MIDNRDEEHKHVAGCEGDKCQVKFKPCPICPSPASCGAVSACSAIYMGEGKALAYGVDLAQPGSDQTVFISRNEYGVITYTSDDVTKVV